MPYDGPYSTAPGECAAYGLLQSGWVLGDCATCCLQVQAFGRLLADKGRLVSQGHMPGTTALQQPLPGGLQQCAR